MRRLFSFNSFFFSFSFKAGTAALALTSAIFSPLGSFAKGTEAGDLSASAEAIQATRVTQATQAAQAAKVTKASQSQTDAINSLDISFQSAYAQAKAKTRSQLGPVIIVSSNALLLKDGKRQESSFIPDVYNITKTVDHIPLAIFCILNGETDQKLSVATLEKLAKFKDLVVATQSSVYESDLSKDSLARQHQIIERSLDFIGQVQKAGEVDSLTLQKFTRDLAKLTLLNAYEAISAATKNLDGIVQNWRKNMTPEQWRQLCVVVVSAHMPRAQNSSMQYFEKLLGQSREGGRVIYYDGQYDEEKAIDLLVTHILDREISVSFYKDPWRMHRDLLSDGAAKYLRKHPPSAK
jgi:hypothetical protein